MGQDEAAPLEFLESLPTKRMGAGLLLRDRQSRPMLVEPAYKDDWEIPGGAVEADESPYECVIRETREELGINVEPRRLLVVDYQHAEPHRTESLMFVFDGGVVDDQTLTQISLEEAELTSYAFIDLDRVEDLTSPRLARRLARAIATLDLEGSVYLENGAPRA